MAVVAGCTLMRASEASAITGCVLFWVCELVAWPSRTHFLSLPPPTPWGHPQKGHLPLDLRPRHTHQGLLNQLLVASDFPTHAHCSLRFKAVIFPCTPKQVSSTTTPRNVDAIRVCTGLAINHKHKHFHWPHSKANSCTQAAAATTPEDHQQQQQHFCAHSRPAARAVPLRACIKGLNKHHTSTVMKSKLYQDYDALAYKPHSLGEERGAINHIKKTKQKTKGLEIVFDPKQHK